MYTVEKEITEQTADNDPVGRLLESRDILDGLQADIESVDIKTRLQRKEVLRGEFRQESEGVIVMEDNLESSEIQDGSYLSREDVEEAMKSPFVESDIVHGRHSTKHLNENTLTDEKYVLIDTDPTEKTQDDSAEFQICKVDHIVEITLSDKWAQDRKLQKRFGSYQSAQSLIDQINELKENSVQLSHTDDYFVIEQDKENNVYNKRYMSTMKRCLLCGLLIGGLTSIVGFGWAAASVITFLIFSLDVMNAQTTVQDTERFYFDHISDNDEPQSIDAEDLKEMSIVEEFNERFEVRITKRKAELIPMTLDTKWSLENMSDNLPSADAVQLFEQLGLEDLGDDAKFTARVRRKNTKGTDPCYESECGDWYLYPEKA